MQPRLRHIARAAGLPLLITLILGGVLAPELHRVTHAIDMSVQTAGTGSGLGIETEDASPSLQRHRASTCEQQCQLCRRDLVQVTLLCSCANTTEPTVPLQIAALAAHASPHASSPHVRGPPLV